MATIDYILMLINIAIYNMTKINKFMSVLFNQIFEERDYRVIFICKDR